MLDEAGLIDPKFWSERLDPVRVRFQMKTTGGGFAVTAIQRIRDLLYLRHRRKRGLYKTCRT